MVEIHPQVLQILTKLQKTGPAYIVGGYLRDQICHFIPNDVDIATELTIDQVKKVFPMLTGTQQGLDFGVGRFALGSMQFEISTYDPGELFNSVFKRDFVINSMYHDGKELFDSYKAQEDIANKIIRSLEGPEIHFANRPQAYLRAIRLASQIGFHLDQKLYDFMNISQFVFHENNANRIQQEGYKILTSMYPFMAFHYLTELGFLEREHEFDPHILVSSKIDNINIKVAYFASVIGEKAMITFIELFQLSKKILEKLHMLAPYLYHDTIPEHPFVLNEVILIKRLQYANEPQKMQQFLLSIRGSK